MMYDSLAVNAQVEFDNLNVMLDEWYDKNADKLQSLSDLKKDLSKKESDINEKLKDAEGDRYNDLLAQLSDVEKQKEAAAEEEKRLKNQEIKQLNAIEQARYESDKASKEAAIISAVIQGALAVIKSLPNLVLAALTSVAVGTGISAISKQRIKPPKVITPIAAEGGLLSGKSHATGGVNVTAEGGEFVTNKAATRAFLPILNAINAAGKKMAEGGEVIGQSNPAQPAVSTELIDYERLADAIANRPQFVSWQEWKEIDSGIRVVENRSSV
jgi:hypothetical protein